MSGAEQFAAVGGLAIVSAVAALAAAFHVGRIIGRRGRSAW
jgi:hypothetical protein